MYKTKIDNEQKQFPTGMNREISQGKPRFDLLFSEGIPYDDQIITRFAKLVSRGAG